MFKMNGSNRRRNIQTHTLVSAREKFIWRGSKPPKCAQDEMDLHEGSEDEELNRSLLRKKSKAAQPTHDESPNWKFYVLDEAVDAGDREVMSVETDTAKEHLPDSKS